MIAGGYFHHARSRKQVVGVLEGSDVEVSDTLLAKILMVRGKSDETGDGETPH